MKRNKKTFMALGLFAIFGLSILMFNPLNAQQNTEPPTECYSANIECYRYYMPDDGPIIVFYGIDISNEQE